MNLCMIHQVRQKKEIHIKTNSIIAQSSIEVIKFNKHLQYVRIYYNIEYPFQIFKNVLCSPFVIYTMLNFC